MSVTFDTNELLSSMLWEGSVSQKLLYDLLRLDVDIYSSQKILDEYKKVLKRDFDLSEEDIEEILKNTIKFVKLVTPDFELDAVKNDPKDNLIIECAIESKFKYIITYDNHLLNLKEYKGIQIIRPEIARAIY